MQAAIQGVDRLLGWRWANTAWHSTVFMKGPMMLKWSELCRAGIERV